MLDVHPPHSPTHTWKDFFIHVGTICVGLLIAVGLEQTVEYFHRQHERHLLEHELRAEAQIEQRNAEINIGQFDARLKFVLARRKDISLMIATNGKANLPSRTFVPPPRGNGVPGTGQMTITNTIWESARSEGRLALLPEGVKRAYGIVSARKMYWDALAGEVRAAEEAVDVFLYQFSDIHAKSPEYLPRLSEAQWLELRNLVTKVFVKLRALRLVTLQVVAETNLVLGDEMIDQQALTPADRRFNAEAEAAHPEDLAKMADEIDAEDAARDKATPKPAQTPK